MGVKDIAGVFSRYFVLGFFLPSFFTLIALSQFLSRGLLPNDYEHYEPQTQVLILGGAAVLLGLLLSGLHHHLLRLFEGYPLEAGKTKPNGVVDRLRVWKSCRWVCRFDRLMRDKNQPEQSEARTAAAQLLSRYYPARRDHVMPTRFGNIVRSFERHPRSRWGLDGVTIWPRVEMLLSQQQLDLITDARTDVAFFVNATFGSAVVGVFLFVDGFVNTPLPAVGFFLYVVPFVLAYLFYRASSSAALAWGDEVRAAFDLCRMDLYRRLGVRVPHTHRDEVVTARHINRCLLYGEPIPGSIRQDVGDPSEGD